MAKGVKTGKDLMRCWNEPETCASIKKSFDDAGIKDIDY